MQRTLVVACIAATAYGVLLVAGSKPGFPAQAPTGMKMPYLSDKPIGEDGYYMLTVAWHLGNGLGLTYNQDGATTGIQPLSTVLDAGVAAIVGAAGGDRWTFARVMLAIGLVYWVALSWIVGRLAGAIAAASGSARSREIGIFATLLALLSYNAFRMSTYGLETPLYLMLFCCCVWLTLKRPTSLMGAVAIGLVAGLTALARIDFLVTLSVFLAFQLLRGPQYALPSIITGVTAALVASPWFAVVYSITGHIMPTSGRAQQAWPADGPELLLRLSHMGDAVSQHLSPWLYAPATHAAITNVIGTAAANPIVSLAIGAVGVVVAWLGGQTLPRDTRRTLAGWLAALAILFTVYVARFGWVFFFERYTAPLMVLAIPLLAIGLAHSVADRRVLIALPVVMLIGFAVSAWVTLHSGRVGNANSMSAGFIARHLPAPAVVGAYQAGVVGYYNSNVVNLDGKMNAAVIEAAATNTFNDYVEKRGITHLVDWPEVTKPPSLFSTWSDCGLGRVGYSACFVKPAR